MYADLQSKAFNFILIFSFFLFWAATTRRHSHILRLLCALCNLQVCNFYFFFLILVPFQWFPAFMFLLLLLFCLMRKVVLENFCARRPRCCNRNYTLSGHTLLHCFVLNLLLRADWCQRVVNAFVAVFLCCHCFVDICRSSWQAPPRLKLVNPKTEQCTTVFGPSRQ